MAATKTASKSSGSSKSKQSSSRETSAANTTTTINKQSATVAHNKGKALAAEQTIGGTPEGTTKPQNAYKPEDIRRADDPDTRYPVFTGDDGVLVIEFEGKRVAYDREGAAAIQRRVGRALGNL